MALVSKNFSDIITFTRASAGWHYNSNGVLVQAASNAPRFDYDPVAKAIKGLLIEEQRTNLLLNSEGNVSTLVSASGVADAATSISGFAASLRIADNAALRYAYRSNGVSASTPYALSLFVQMDDNSTPVVGTSSALGDFCLTVGSAIVTAPSTVTPVGNNVYRVSTSVTTSASPGVNNGIVKYTTQSAKGFRVTGYQLEQGSFATSYIPTAGSQVTRAADVASVNTLSPWFNASEGTFYTEFSSIKTGGEGHIVHMRDATASARIAIRAPVGANVDAVVTSGDTQADFVGIPVVVGAYHKIAFAYRQNDFAFRVDSAAVEQDTLGSVPLVDRMYIGSSGSGTFFNGHVKRVQYIPRRLTNAELQALTA